MRDIKDQPILNTAVTYDIDVLITGDKHFYSATHCQDKILTELSQVLLSWYLQLLIRTLPLEDVKGELCSFIGGVAGDP